MKCKGFLFDLDGTLIDSLAVVERTWAHWGRQRGIDPNEVLDFIHGKQAITSLRHFMPGASAEALQREFRTLEQIESTDTEGIVALPGALQLLETLDEQAIPWAIVTSGSHPIASVRHRVAGLPTPHAFVTAEHVERGKPEPDAYLLGAQWLNLPAEACVVVEDAVAGILSGLAAGCHVIAVNAPAEAPCLRDVDGVLTSLEALIVYRDAEGDINVDHK